jgi:hypothetical protein
MIALMTALSALAALLFLGVVAMALVKIASTLGSIGGRGDSYLAKLRLGLRAIERETSHLPRAAVPLNRDLGQAAAGLKAIDQGLGQLHAALTAQESK